MGGLVVFRTDVAIGCRRIARKPRGGFASRLAVPGGDNASTLDSSVPRHEDSVRSSCFSNLPFRRTTFPRGTRGPIGEGGWQSLGRCSRLIQAAMCAILLFKKPLSRGILAAQSVWVVDNVQNRIHHRNALAKLGGVSDGRGASRRDPLPSQRHRFRGPITSVITFRTIG